MNANSSIAFYRVDRCDVCGNDPLDVVLSLGLHPLCDDLVPVGDTRRCREYPIEIAFCRICRTAQQRFRVPQQELFPSSYHYRARFTTDVVEGMAALVESCERRFGSLAGKRVLDIGCNDGSLLDFFRGKSAVTFGIEPSDAWLEAQQKGHQTYQGFLSPLLAEAIVSSHGKPEFITMTNVFAHIEDLANAIRSLKLLIRDDTKIVIENHYLGSVLEGNQFDTFYHEHARTYGCTSFVHLARALALPLLGYEFPSRYGGNIRVFLGCGDGNCSRSDTVAEPVEEQQFTSQFTRLSRNIDRWRERKARDIRAHVRSFGKMKAKAFPARAAMLIRLLGLNEDSVSAVYEKRGSLKIGHYVPGTRIPIRSDEELFSSGERVRPLLNLAWHIPQEIRAYMADNGYPGPIIDIIDPSDFEVERPV